MNGLARVLVLGGGRAAAAGFSFLGALLVARALSRDELGAWSLALAVQGYALHVSELGLRSVATRETARCPGALRELLQRYLALRLTLCAIVLGVVALGTWLLVPGATVLVALATGSIVLTALQLDWVALADDRPLLAAALVAVRPLAFAAALLLWPGAPTSLAVAGLFLAGWGAAALLSWTALLGRRAAAPGAALPASAMLRDGLPLAVVTILNQALLSADLVLAGIVLGAGAAGDFYLAAQIATSGLVLANAAGQAALSRLAALEAGSAARALAGQLRLATITGCVLALGIAAAAPPLLPHLFGTEHAAAVRPLLALLPWLVLQHPSTVLQGALAAQRRGGSVLRGNLWMLAALVPALALAAASGSLVAFGFARSLAEAVKLAVLAHALRGPASEARCPAQPYSTSPSA